MKKRTLGGRLGGRFFHLMRDFISDVFFIVLMGALTLLFFWKLAFTSDILADYDLFTYFYPYRDYAFSQLREGHIPLWNPYIFGGVPFLANIQAGVLYPLNLALMGFDAPEAVKLSFLFHVWLAGTSMFLFLRLSLALSRMGSFMGALAFMFGGFFSAQAGHINQVNAAAWAPLLFLAFDHAYKRGSVPLVALGGIIFALQLLAGHPQESYITAVGLALFTVVVAFRNAAEDVKASMASGSRALPLAIAEITLGAVIMRVLQGVLILGVMLALGSGLAAAQLLPTLELAQHSIRAGGMDYREAVSFSLPPQEILRAVFPPFRENPYSEFIGYIGFMPLALAFLAIGLGRLGKVAPFLVLILGALFLAFGGYNPLSPPIFGLMPGLGLFRVPARWLFLYTLAGSSLAALGLDLLLTHRGSRPSLMRGALIGAILGSVSGLLWVAWPFLALPDGEILRLWAIMGGVSALVVVIGVAIGPHRRLLGAGIILFTLVELSLAGMSLPVRHLVPSQVYTSLRPALATLLLDRAPSAGSWLAPFRVLSVTNPAYQPGDLAELRAIYSYLSPEDFEAFMAETKHKEALSPNLSMTFQIPSIDGYDGGLLPTRSYVEMKSRILASRDIMEPLLDGIPPDHPALLLRDQLDGIPDPKLLGALNVKYILTDKLHDAWVNGIYYDLSLVRKVTPDRPLFIANLPSFEATSLGVVSFLLGAKTLPQGEPVARVRLWDGMGREVTRTIRAGVDTAEGPYDSIPSFMAHAKSKVASPWRGKADAYNYIASLDLGGPFYPIGMTVEALNAVGYFYVRGITLIDTRTTASRALTIDPRLSLVHSGDVKIYQNLAWLPKAYVAHQWVVAQTPEAALASLDDSWMVALEKPPKSVVSDRGQIDPSPPLADWPEDVSILGYQAEEVALEARLRSPGILVLRDAYDPGWRAWVDGKEVEVLAANRFFRAVYLPQGEHRVEFRYLPHSLAAGLEVSGWSALATAVLLVIWPLVALVVRLFSPLWRYLGR